MSIEETQKIDLVATRPDSTEVRLVMTDHLDWADPQAHLRLLQEKLNAYIAFVESGQIYDMDEPAVERNAQITIVVAAQEEPPTESAGFFGQVKELLHGIGIRFLVQVQEG